MNAEGAARPIDTGVDGRVFTPTAQWHKTLENVRARERRLSALLPRGQDRDDLLCRLVAAGAGVLEASFPVGRASAEAFCQSILARSVDGRSARDLRERARVLLRLRVGTALPARLDGLLALWSAATAGDPRVYDDLPAHFRREGEHVPFSGDSPGGRNVPPGRETVLPGSILPETEGLIRWIRSGAPLEARAACAYFLFGRIHPFCDGNGRTLRMLVCALLSGAYSDATLLSFVERLQLYRPLLSEAECRVNIDREDLSGFGCLLLRVLSLAQNGLESALQNGAQP